MVTGKHWEASRRFPVASQNREIRMKLTRATVVRLRLPPRKDDVIYFDDTLPGFGIRLRTKGARTWVLQYRRGRQQRRLTLGTVEVLSADQARQAARDRLAMIQLGGDPQA